MVESDIGRAPKKIGRSERIAARLDAFTMPFGKYRGHLVRKVADFDPDYADWLVAQTWFKLRFRDEYLVLGRAIKAAEDPEHQRHLDEQRQREIEAQNAAIAAQHERAKQADLDWHKVNYARRGIMPFGKYKDLPLTIVARDQRYRRWFLGGTYARMNPELAADLRALDYPDVEALGCTVIAFPVARIVSRPHPNDPPEAA